MNTIRQTVVLLSAARELPTSIVMLCVASYGRIISPSSAQEQIRPPHSHALFSNTSRLKNLVYSYTG